MNQALLESNDDRLGTTMFADRIISDQEVLDNLRMSDSASIQKCTSDGLAISSTSFF